jgi:hypothetical protein
LSRLRGASWFRNPAEARLKPDPTEEVLRGSGIRLKPDPTKESFFVRFVVFVVERASWCFVAQEPG